MKPEGLGTLFQEEGEVTAKMVLDTLVQVQNSQREILDTLNTHTREFHDHLRDDSEFFNKLLSAFPNQDTEGHARYHKATIEWLELRNAAIREVLVKAAQAGFLAGMGWALYSLWIAFLKGP